VGQYFSKKTQQLTVLFITLYLSACTNSPGESNKVIVYVSVDQIFSSKILKQFEKEAGIKVEAVYDTESSKAVGLEKRLITEKSSPQADLFWNSEFLRTARLANAGALMNLATEEKTYQKKIGLRSRVFIINTNLIKEKNYPITLNDLTKVQYKGKIALCSPYFGTASTHFAALYYKLGEEKFLHFIKGLKNNNVALLAGNSVVKDAVGYGKYAIGLVDTDDAILGIKQGLPIKMLYYNQEKQGMFSIYQTVSIIKDAPHSKNAKILLEYLSTEKIEQQLIDMDAVQFSLIESKNNLSKPKLWTVEGHKLTKALKTSIKLMRSNLE